MKKQKRKRTYGKTPVERFAWKRNFSKFRLEGVASCLRNLERPFVTCAEENELKLALSHVKNALKTWKESYAEAKEAFFAGSK